MSFTTGRAAASASRPPARQTAVIEAIVQPRPGGRRPRSPRTRPDCRSPAKSIASTGITPSATSRPMGASRVNSVASPCAALAGAAAALARRSEPRAAEGAVGRGLRHRQLEVRLRVVVAGIETDRVLELDDRPADGGLVAYAGGGVDELEDAEQ